jgi:energy-coupling factor transporter ATP-binding protein EcfA2
MSASASTSPPRPAPAIEAADLVFRYHDGTEALRGLSLRVEPGESVCLAGPNGAGKSTLLLCLAGLVRGGGSVRVGGAEVSGSDGGARLGLVFQDPDDQLFCPTVGEDVAFGPRNGRLPEEEVARRVAESLAAVNLAGFEARSAHHLSGGEKKRAAIAAVLACRPEILALDEPWANLDARAARAVTGIIRAFAGTRIVASQDLHHAAAVCERLVILDGGKVVADGPMRELLADAALLDAHGLEFTAICPSCRASLSRKDFAAESQAGEQANDVPR